MNFEDLAFGWREALLGVIALLALYVFLAVRRLRRLRGAAAVAGSTASGVDLASARGASETPVPVGIEPTGVTGAAAYAAASFPWNEPPEPSGFPEPQDEAETAEAGDKRLTEAEAEIAGLRAELDVLRGEMTAMREELKQTIERMQAVQNIAPVYGDAMQMAVAGYDAASIAERCGVARAEAELVVALIRNREVTEPSMRER